MKKFLSIAIITLVSNNYVNAASYHDKVVKACFVTDKFKSNITMRPGRSKEDADICVYVEQNCENADLHIFVDTLPVYRKYFISESKFNCRS